MFGLLEFILEKAIALKLETLPVTVELNLNSFMRININIGSEGIYLLCLQTILFTSNYYI